MTRPPALPRPVPFPVYGVAGHTGTRQLTGWNDPGYLWTVSLVHDDPERDRTVRIETLRRQARPQQDDDEFPHDPVRIDSAALHAISVAVDLPTRRSKKKAALMELMDAELQLIDLHDDGGVELLDWDELTLVVDDGPAAARSRLINGTRAVLVELPEVILGITAAPDVDLRAMRLVDVREHLDDSPWPSIREHMRPRREAPPAPPDQRLLPLYIGLLDILANAQDDATEPNELLARIEYVADGLLHTNLPAADRP